VARTAAEVRQPCGAEHLARSLHFDVDLVLLRVIAEDAGRMPLQAMVFSQQSRRDAGPGRVKSREAWAAAVVATEPARGVLTGNDRCPTWLP